MTAAIIAEEVAKAFPCDCDQFSNGQGIHRIGCLASWIDRATAACHAVAARVRDGAAAEIARLTALVAPTVGDGPLWDQKIPGPTDELRRRWGREASHAWCSDPNLTGADEKMFTKGYALAKWRDWYFYEIVCQREHRDALVRGITFDDGQRAGGA